MGQARLQDRRFRRSTPGQTLKAFLKTAEGRWITGLRANIRAWEHTPFRYFWRILDWPVVSPVSHWCYEVWLRKRDGAKRGACVGAARCARAGADTETG